MDGRADRAWRRGDGLRMQHGRHHRSARQFCTVMAPFPSSLCVVCLVLTRRRTNRFKRRLTATTTTTTTT